MFIASSRHSSRCARVKMWFLQPVVSRSTLPTCAAQSGPLSGSRVCLSSGSSSPSQLCGGVIHTMARSFIVSMGQHEGVVLNCLPAGWKWASPLILSPSSGPQAEPDRSSAEAMPGLSGPLPPPPPAPPKQPSVGCFESAGPVAARGAGGMRRSGPGTRMGGSKPQKSGKGAREH